MNYKIVCVDDEQEVLEVILESLSVFDLEVVGFTDPREALQYIENNHKQIIFILSDFKMNNFSGFDLKESVNKITRDIPFSILTGFYDRDMATQAMSLGISKFLEKPFDKEDIDEIYEEHCLPRISLLNDEREMTTGFIQEAYPMLDEIEGLILDLEENPNNDKTLAVYFRLLHTIKGTASSIGLSIMGDYAHKYEDFIGLLRNGQLSFSTDVANVLLSGLDGLKKLFDLTNDNFTDSDFDLEAEVKVFDQDFKDQGHLEISVGNQKEPDHPPANEDKKEDDKMTVNMSTLDEFMEESGELTVIRNTISKTVKKIESKYRDDSDVDLLNELLDGMYKVTGNIQNKISELRKVQLVKTFRPFKRLVRDISKSLDKDIEFTIKGEEIFVDNIIAKIFSNTMIHLLRNSLDHGVEDRATRLSSGKAEQGTVSLSIIEAGDEIHCFLEDDGKGIDPDIIKEKAVEKGLYTHDELNFMSNRDIINIIFDSGFSTAETVSDLSGRGVGMDMVKGTIENYGGSIVVDSELGKGSKFILKIPVPKSVLIVNTLQVKVNQHIFKLHMEDVTEVISIGENDERSQIHNIQDDRVFVHNEEVFPIIFLGELLGLRERKVNSIENIVIMRFQKTRFAVVVDDIEDFEEVVCKKISDQIVSSHLYSGASLLGTGEVAMILSAEGLCKESNITNFHARRVKSQIPNELIQDSYSEENQYILLRSSLKQSFCIPLDSVSRLEKISSKEIQFVGNNMVFKYNGVSLPLLFPLDLLGLGNIKDELIKDEALNLIVLKSEKGLYALIVETIDDIINRTKPMDQLMVKAKGLKGTFYIEDELINVLDPEYFEDFAFKRIKLNEDLAS